MVRHVNVSISRKSPITISWNMLVLETKVYGSNMSEKLSFFQSDMQTLGDCRFTHLSWERKKEKTHLWKKISFMSRVQAQVNEWLKPSWMRTTFLLSCVLLFAFFPLSYLYKKSGSWKGYHKNLQELVLSHQGVSGLMNEKENWLSTGCES